MGGGVADRWAAKDEQPTRLPPYPSKKPFTSVIHSVMPFTQDIKIQLHPLCANNVKTHYNWSPWDDSSTKRAKIAYYIKAVN
jgi:hypothetical protein